MRRSRIFALAFFLLSPILITSSSAQNAPQCPIMGSLSDWGIKSIGYIEITPDIQVAIIFPFGRQVRAPMVPVHP